ncbi:hypothetical protein [Streptomyces sp. NPDC088748]|uniref:hypothetical protein n=1 Tax=Streptomyces sp. NPDC088748 TaxID=3365887 RepID=UPI0038198F6A
MQLAASERLVGVLVEGVDGGLVGGARARLRRLRFGAGRHEFGDDLAGGGEVREAASASVSVRAAVKCAL